MKSLTEIRKINGTPDSYVHRPIVCRFDRYYYLNSDQSLGEPVKKAKDEAEQLGDLLAIYIEQPARCLKLSNNLKRLSMSTLAKEVALPQTAPKGLRLLTDFISESDEQLLIAKLAKLDWDGLGMFKRRGQIVKRREIDFLHDYGRHNRQISEGPPLPFFLRQLCEDCAKLVELDTESFQQVITTLYRPGAGIDWHIDSTDAFGEIICGLSLGSNCMMQFGKEKTKRGKKKYKPTYRVELTRRSLMITQGQARYAFAHRISPVKRTRYSITLRTLA